MLHQFKAEVQPDAPEGTLLARIVPFGVPVPYGSGTVEFAQGGIDYPDAVPLTIDHAPGVLNRIGVMSRHYETDEGSYAEFTLAPTQAGNEVRELLKLGAVTDVSVGVAFEGKVEKHTVMSGTLDHVAVVDHGRFSSDSVSKPARVLAVHDDKEPNVAEVIEEATAPVVAEYDDSEVRQGLVELAERVDAIPVADRAPEFTPLEVFAAAVGARNGVPIVNNALADVIGDLGSADASGIVPDTYWGGGLQHLTDRRRPLFATSGAAPFPAVGNALEVPRVSQSTAVAPRTAEKSEPGTQALQAIVNTFPLVWFSGAVDISMEIISQSDPSVLQVVAQDMLTQYAIQTEIDATTKLTVAATHTGAALDTSTYAAFVADVITTSDLIEDATGAPGDILGVTPAEWIAILSLMDGGDRRQFSMVNPQNADGSGSLVTRGIDIGGVFVYRAPKATSAVQYSQTSYKAGEKSPMSVSVDSVALMGVDTGLLGATVNVFWPAGIYSYEV